MQVDYDSSYLNEETESQNKGKNRTKMITSHKTGIVEVEMEDSSDYEALTTLYRKIFRFLLEFAPNSKPSDREVEREIAAALESVFPRVGLKAFIQLNSEEKSSQLLELGRIILGIRLFNRDEGRGGAGLDNMDTDGNILANVLSQDIDREVEFFSDACQKYQKAIVKAHVLKRRKLYEKHLEEEHLEETDEYGNIKPVPLKSKIKMKINNSTEEISDYMIERWSQELANRRQYLGYLRTLQDESHYLLDKISSICEKIRTELVNVRSLVTNKASVPKEVVYPRFDALGLLWIQLFDEVITMIARSNTFQTLCKYRLSFSPTLTENYYLDNSNEELSLADALGQTKSGKKEKKAKGNQDTTTAATGGGGPQVVTVPVPVVSYNELDAGASMTSAGGSAATAGQEEDTGLALDSVLGVPTATEEDAVQMITDSPVRAPMELAEGTAAAVSTEGIEDNQEALATTETQAPQEQTLAVQTTGEDGEQPEEIEGSESGLVHEEVDETVLIVTSGARLLTAEDTPDFMMLPLELQGYCPWTIIEARGLLVPGKPALGIINFENANYVCDNAVAIKAFMTDPHSYLTQIKERALRNPEYIHLLRLQRWFPTASIARLLKIHEMETNNKSGLPLTKDAGTSTPTHFIDSYIDINYHWNEWELRRRALKIVNLKNCVTSSQQTDESHFKRDSDTQVYLPRIKGTQTKREKGINPPTVSTYVAGLRGKQVMSEDRRTGKLNDAYIGNNNSSSTSTTTSSSVNQWDQEVPPSVNDPVSLHHPQAGVVTLTLDMSSYHGYPLTSSGIKYPSKFAK